MALINNLVNIYIIKLCLSTVMNTYVVQHTNGEGSPLIAQVVEEPVALLQPEELVGDDALRGRAQQGGEAALVGAAPAV